MDIYSYLFKDLKKTSKIVYRKETFKISKNSKEKEISYLIENWASLTIDKNDYSSSLVRDKKEFSKMEDKKFLEIVDIINNYNYVNYCILKDNLSYYDADYAVVNSLSGFENIYLKNRYFVLQKDFPKSKGIDILKSNSYYFDKYFRENIESLIEFKIKDLIVFLKKIYGNKFNKLSYLNDIKSLEKFDYTLKEFILEKANLSFKSCYLFFYKNMGRVLDDLYLLPKTYIIFYN